MQCGEAGSAVWTRIGEATRCATEADALRTGRRPVLASSRSHWLGCVRGEKLPLGAVLSRRDRRATWRCPMRTSAVSATSRMRSEASVCESALSAQGGARLPADHARRRSFRSCAHRCRREATPSQTAFTLLPRFGDAQSPNRAMELTATRRTTSFSMTSTFSHSAATHASGTAVAHLVLVRR